MKDKYIDYNEQSAMENGEAKHIYKHSDTVQSTKKNNNNELKMQKGEKKPKNNVKKPVINKKVDNLDKNQIKTDKSSINIPDKNNLPKKTYVYDTSSEKEITKKQKGMTSSLRNTAVTFAVVGTLVVGAIGIALYENTKNMNDYSAVLEGVYTSAYYNMVNDVNEIYVDSEKILATSDADMQKTILSNISTNCEVIVNSLSVLPLNNSNVIDATKFFNQLNGLTESYIQKLDNGENIDENDLLQLNQVSNTILAFKEILNTHNIKITGGNYRFLDTYEMNKKGNSEFSSSLGDLSSASIDYPAMIFDGPFSESLKEKEIKGLSENIIDKEFATNIVQNVIFEGYNIKITDITETDGDFESWNYYVTVEDDFKYELDIAKRDGYLLTMNASSVGSLAKVTEDDAQEIAVDFSNQIGLHDMKVVWVESSDNISYINLAYVEKDVIMYSDLVKIKVDLSNGNVIGFEGQNYAYNHTERNIKFDITEDAAKSVLLEDELLIEINKAVIPMPDEIEKTVYELVVEKIDGKYYIYVSAEDCGVVKVMKEITTDSVHKLL